MWGQGINNQGKLWESFLQKSLPEGTLNLNDIKSNFKAFDFYTSDGVAISAKTMDTIGSKTYQTSKNITSVLNSYVNKMLKFDGDGRGIFQLRETDITAKELHLAIPSKTTSTQMQAIHKCPLHHKIISFSDSPTLKSVLILSQRQIQSIGYWLEFHVV